jgi:hypothetical protein
MKILATSHTKANLQRRLATIRRRRGMETKFNQFLAATSGSNGEKFEAQQIVQADARKAARRLTQALAAKGMAW